MPTHKIWSNHVTQVANFENFNLDPYFALNVRKVTRLLVLKFATSEVISKNKKKIKGSQTRTTVLPVHFGLNLHKTMAFTTHFQNFLAKIIVRCRVQG